ncbi:MAG: isoleucine--tRNA ligase, partial [DPANN group archaeon]|nr:isoleucine--tRNA ligase [DPANN group archaeon]
MELKYDPLKQEPAIQNFWDSKNIYKKLKKKLAKAKPYFFLDGPPYTTGAIHIGHAWNYSMKDSYRRYLRMRGFNVNDTPGFDTHGLPIEVKVEKKLGIRNKQEIVEKIGLAKFAEECQNFALENMHPMIKDFERLGVWMDWDSPYMTFKNYYIEGAWWALKKAHENNFLYEGEKVMTWCPRCGTALAKHELEYKDVTDESILIKFKIANSENEFLTVWTTTPWTIPFDLAVMVHPEFEYAKVKVGDEIWIIAKDLVEKTMKIAGKQGSEILQIVKGKDLEGIKYIHPMAEIIPELKELSKKANVHTVILTDKYVDLQAGTGLVHSAPGCGPEDYEVCKSYGIPAYNTIDEFGNFPTSMGQFAGLVARKDDVEFIKYLENNNILIGKTKITHEYAHCWRCYTGIVYKLTSQWFLATEKLKRDMLSENSKTHWTPDWAGSEWFTSWLDNIQDWCISRQRFWGIPLPIWRCKECKFITVIESAQELKKNSGRPPQNLHRPWIDEVIIKCKQCRGPMYRVPDVMDVWLDSGAAPWASLADQKKNSDAVAEFILEGKDQIRGWFNSLMALSMVARKKTSYKSVFMHGMIVDVQGRKMSKSLGNTISPYEAVDTYGADALR